MSIAACATLLINRSAQTARNLNERRQSAGFDPLLELEILARREAQRQRIRRALHYYALGVVGMALGCLPIGYALLTGAVVLLFIGVFYYWLMP